MGAEAIILLISIFSVIVGAVAFGLRVFFKRLLPKWLDSNVDRTDNMIDFFKAELKGMRQERRKETEEFLEAVHEQSEAVREMAIVASNHLTEFSEHICDEVKALSEKDKERNELRDQVLINLANIFTDLAIECPHIQTKYDTPKEDIEC